jgi:transposase InsO family protein
MSKMDARRRLANLVIGEGWSVSAAAREMGVSRPTAHLWVSRALGEGLADMRERPRRPKTSPGASPPETVERVLALADEYPFWGSRKLRALLWPDGGAPVSDRTVARIMARNGRKVGPSHTKPAAPQRFERAASNELWQADFKRVGHHRHRTDSLSVVDDAHRFCIKLAVVPDQTLESVWSVLWEAFGEYGMPEQMLTDNGASFRNNATWRWSRFDLMLMLLGIRSAHGRPYHPQTQGKVERFHGTIEREIRFERDADVQEELSRFRDRYNWVRPHDSLDNRTPGSLYKPSPRKRPDRMPEPFFPEGTLIRKAQDRGVIRYDKEKYVLGRAFEGYPVGILNDDTGTPMVVWGNFALAPLRDFKV